MAIESFIGNADEFPILRNWDFFNHAGVSPIPRRVADAMREFVTNFEERAYLESGVYRQIDALRQSAAGLINADPGEIAIIKNTSEGIATVANGIEWVKGDRIVTTAVEYPANMYPWMDISRRFGVELLTVPEESTGDGRSVPLQKILEACDHPRTKLLTLSHVEFASGQRHDLATLGRFCRDRGILFNVDGIQALGALPVDVRAMQIDFLSADGHKWMLGPEGAGIFFCRRELLERMRPLIVGWMNVIDDDNYGAYDFTLKSDARRFECGSHNLAGVMALRAAIDLLREAGIQAIANRLKSVTGLLIEGLVQKGYRILSPRGGESWSGIVSFESSKHDHHAIFRELRRAHRTEIAVREGRLRVSAHFYNTEEQIARLIGHLAQH